MNLYRMLNKNKDEVTMAERIHYKARETRFIVSHQRPLPLRPATSTVIIAFQAMKRSLLMAVVLRFAECM